MSMFTSVVLLASLLLGLVALGLALVRTVRDDGLGHRPPPATRPGATQDRTW
ncbi:hypothetical protein [Cellulomonas sp. S1-8]|uniref:hypothetical protein n=1 Tax=Cellulomonas sp. S1-8 TaxID=2904790 RepID=UPI0022431790|nr:hypothetical protein [Cellulomonas sp. S1-8]UZN01686.1 hypothetical protein OKX07_11285 [Cellulomonas sp. S1-8]